MEQERFTYLMDQWVRKTITAEETAELQGLLKDLDQLGLPQVLGETWLQEATDLHRLPVDRDEADSQAEIDSQAEAILAVDKNLDWAPVRRVHFFGKAWFRYAAAIIILFAAGTYFWKLETKNPSLTKTGANKTQLQTAPAKQGAVLTLADGTKVPLDSVGNGLVADQNGTQVVLKDGSLAYNTGDNPSAGMIYNAVSTPKGRQFQLVLPDKSKVWLNAASSIRYPTAFAGNERVVEIKGEAYFEIEKDQRKPFKVKINDAAAVEVLGTSFNVNAYENEDAIQTTLIEGAVRVNGSKPLKPGQQAKTYPNATIKVVDGINVDQIVAWKNGYFDFDKADLQVMMRKLERWYDITVQYKGSPPNMVFKGTMDLHMQLPDIIRFLNASGIKASLEGRTLIITGP
jgi:ferric-dicitrate binding protein FerR (iron transport regulator)